MVKQGEIVSVCLDPKRGHEQAGYRPAIVVSNDFFNRKTGLAVVCPITNTNNGFPLHVPLDDRTATRGFILCEHMRTLDLSAHACKPIEQAPPDIVDKVLSVLFAELRP